MLIARAQRHQSNRIPSLPHVVPNAPRACDGATALPLRITVVLGWHDT